MPTPPSVMPAKAGTQDREPRSDDIAWLTPQNHVTPTLHTMSP